MLHISDEGRRAQAEADELQGKVRIIQSCLQWPDKHNSWLIKEMRKVKNEDVYQEH